MKIEILKKAVELNKQREDILKQFRKLFSITDPHFQPISVREDSGCVFIVGISGKEVKVDLRVRIVVNGKTDLIINDTSAGIKWIEEQIERLSEINKEIYKL